MRRHSGEERSSLKTRATQYQVKRPCPVCEETRAELLFRKEGFDIVRCRGCRMRYVDLLPEEGFATDYYTEDFFKDGYHKYGYVDYVADAANHRRMAAAALRFMERYVKGGRLLDVGCAAGYFLEALGPEWDVYGCEPCRGMADIARRKFGDRIAAVPFEQYQSDVKFDVVTMWDSLEHLVDPSRCIAAAHDLLADSGHLVLRTPDAGSPAAKLLGKSWYHYGPPGHLHFFDRKTIDALLKRHGFRVLRVVYLPRYVSLSEVLINLGAMLGSKRLKSLSARLADGSGWNVSIPYQVFDEMVVMALKGNA